MPKFECRDGTVSQAVAGLNDAERACLARYCALLAERVRARRGVDVRVRGARGHVAARFADALGRRPARRHARRGPGGGPGGLLNETYPLYLECGRQLSPHFFSRGRLAAPVDDRTREFLRELGADAVVVWPT
jgi:hypothetical protein